jgi:hypothetical protein
MLRGLFRLNWRQPPTSRDADAGIHGGRARLWAGGEAQDIAMRIARKTGDKPQAVLLAALRFAEANPDSFARFARLRRIAGIGRAAEQRKDVGQPSAHIAEKTARARSFPPRLSLPMTVELFTSLLFLVGVAASAILILAGL